MRSGLGFLGWAGLGETSFHGKFELVISRPGSSHSRRVRLCQSEWPMPCHLLPELSHGASEICPISTWPVLPSWKWVQLSIWSKSSKTEMSPPQHKMALLPVTENLKLGEMGSPIIGNGIVVYFRPTCYRNNQKSHGGLYFPDGRTTLSLTTCPWVTCLFATSQWHCIEI